MEKDDKTTTTVKNDNIICNSINIKTDHCGKNKTRLRNDKRTSIMRGERKKRFDTKKRQFQKKRHGDKNDRNIQNNITPQNRRQKKWRPLKDD